MRYARFAMRNAWRATDQATISVGCLQKALGHFSCAGTEVPPETRPMLSRLSGAGLGPRNVIGTFGALMVLNSSSGLSAFGSGISSGLILLLDCPLLGPASVPATF